MSLFPPPSTSQPAQDASPFAKLANSQPLGGLGASQPQQQSSPFSGFGTLGASQPQPQSSPFSGLGAQSNAQPPQNSFGALGTSKAQPTPAGGGAGAGFLGFAQSAKSQPQQTQHNPATSQPLGFSLFAPQQPQQPSQQPSQQLQNQNGQPQEESSQPSPGSAKIAQPAYFNSLLEKGKKRARVIDGEPAFGELPTLQLGLEDIARRARELGGFPSQEKGHPTDGKALDQL